VNPRSASRSKYIYLFYLILSSAVYSASFDNEFREDDFDYIRCAHELEDIRQIFRPNDLFSFYRPGSLMLFYVEYEVFGPKRSGAYLAFNFIIHVLISLSLVRVLRRLEIDRRTAYLAGGLFLLGLGHYGKKVMWACTSGPLLAVLLSVSVVWLTVAYMHSMTESSQYRRGYLVGAGILMLLAPAFHETGLTAPVLATALLFIHGRRSGKIRGRNRYWLPLAPAALALTAWGIAYCYVSGSHEAYRRACHTLAHAPVLLFRHLGFMIMPIKPSSLMDGQPVFVQWLSSNSTLIHGAIALIIICASVYVFVRGNQVERFLAVWMYLALAPFCFVDLPEGWLELRYLYFTAMPFCSLIAIALMKGLYIRGGIGRWTAIALTILATSMTIYVTVILESKYDSLSRNDPDQHKLEEFLRLHP
jgi:hypothetical protein